MRKYPKPRPLSPATVTLTTMRMPDAPNTDPTLAARLAESMASEVAVLARNTALEDREDRLRGALQASEESEALLIDRNKRLEAYAKQIADQLADGAQELNDTRAALDAAVATINQMDAQVNDLRRTLKDEVDCAKVQSARVEALEDEDICTQAELWETRQELRVALDDLAEAEEAVKALTAEIADMRDVTTDPCDALDDEAEGL